MRERLETLCELLRVATRPNHRRYFLPVLVLILVGALLALGAAYPLLSPFLYSMF